MSVAAKKLRNAAATREAILAAAKLHFVHDSYDQVGIRAIAADAGIDPAMISRYFGSKSGLFAEVLNDMGKDSMEIFTGDRATFGKRIAALMLDQEKHFPECHDFINLVTRSSGSDEARTTLKRHIDKQFIRPFSDWLGDADAEAKSWLILSILMGLTITDDIRPLPVADSKTLAFLLQSVLDA